ncbi:MAG: NADH-quinone oxidoreductase subunit H, partial [Clostridiales bacterium]|nr:NADH-quinone oxidoreductase subunit H [Clostridiales bacterium]
LISAVFFPLYVANPFIGFLLYLAKTLVLLFILIVFRTVMARLRIEQMVTFCWKYLTPLALLQVLINLLLKGVL